MADIRRAERLFVVEDDPDNLALMMALLGDAYIVRGFGSSADALLDLEDFKPQLVVLDIGMYPMNGMECLLAIRAVPGYSGIPAIALTGFASAGAREKFLSAGFQAVVTKPILDRRGLETLIDGLLMSVSP